MGVYSIWDYILYISILAIFYFLFTKFFLSRIKINRDFLLAISPFIFFGVFVRVLTDVNFFPRDKFWSITPGVYIFSFSLAILSITLGKILEKFRKDFQYWKISFFIGFLLSLLLFFYILPHVKHLERFFYPLAIAFTISYLVFLLSKILKIRRFHKIENFSIIFAHMLDASSTFIAYNFFGFDEEHLLPRFLISIFWNNAFVMIPIKLSLILAFLYLIENYENSEEKKLIKLLVFIFGIGPGLRNTILPSLSF